MKTKMKLSLRILTGVLIFTSGFASAAGWSGASTIDTLYPSPSHNGILIKHNSMPNPDGCPSSSYYILSKDNILFSEIYSLLLSSQARKSSINLQLVDCSGQNNTFPSINQVIAD